MSPANGLNATRHPELVARDLLGWTIVCRGAAAVITETEAYHQDEPAAHSYGGCPTPRTQGLFGPPGYAYVYVSYGIHRCMNLVTGTDGSGEAVLLRAAVPVAGKQLIQQRRGRSNELLTGPGRLAQGLDVRLSDTGRLVLREDIESVTDALKLADDGPLVVRDLAAAAAVGIELPITADRVLVGTRIGITKAVELPWRFGVRSAPVSRPFR